MMRPLKPPPTRNVGPQHPPRAIQCLPSLSQTTDVICDDTIESSTYIINSVANISCSFITLLGADFRSALIVTADNSFGNRPGERIHGGNISDIY
ncbi:hypothetical protein EVAR_14801_1 [Eumeta japonica]|uniref:Uncharacterized protein n=1 Tax=Eumeta variegata TaxID=151549 RepID=A0A4C1TWV2_EUMVA|nr:hypothetical protein EVAR_14801_1 [Eumeta japonica]